MYKHIYAELLLPFLFPVFILQSTNKGKIKFCVRLYFMYQNYYQSPVGSLETFVLKKRFHKNIK